MTSDAMPATTAGAPFPRRGFLLLTRTTWDEPPRLRHQVAELLASRGHEVLFGERPVNALRKAPGRARTGVPGIRFLGHRELVHHKLRAAAPLRWVNSAWTARSLRASLRGQGVTDGTVVLNFNYDYCFLRDVFPRNPVVTIINDDFITNAPRPFQPALYRAQDLTCMASDAVLCTSPVVMERLRAGPPPELFMPWASEPYARPPAGRRRNVLLYWGYLGHRLDRGVVRRLAGWAAEAMPDMVIRLVGPSDPGSDLAGEFAGLRNVEVSGPVPLGALPLDDVFASFIPYVEGVPEIDAIVFPNKLFQLLAKGTPMVISGMPHFIKEPFVFRVGGRSREADLAAIAEARRSHDALQDRIEAFLGAHGPEGRLAQLMGTVARAEARRAGRA